MLQYNPTTVNDGLIFYFDAGNNKSYPYDTLPFKNNCILWLDASDSSSLSFKTSSLVTTWFDKSGYNNNAIQQNITESFYPTYRGNSLNNKGGITFVNANTQSFDLTNRLQLSSFTAFCVISSSSTTGHIFADSASFNGESRIAFTSTPAPVITDSNGNQLATGAFNFPATIYSVTYTSGSVIAYNTGSQSSSTGSLTQPFYLNVIGKRRSSATALGNMDGDINEIVLYDRVLSKEERNKVHTYLGQKWGITNSDRTWFSLINPTVTASFAASGTGTNIGQISYNESPPYLRLPLVSSGSLLRYDFPVNSSLLSINAGTIEMVARFAYTSGSTNTFLFNSIGTGTNRFYIRGIVSSGPTYYLDAIRGTNLGDIVIINSNVGFNTWFHVTMTWNYSTFFVYLNGNLITSRAYTNGGTSTSFVIGGGGATEQCFPGDISYCKIYNKMLSSTEILKNYQNLKGRYNL